MIRNVMFGISMLALSAGSAFAATPVATTHHTSKARVVAAAPAGDTAAPAADKPAKKEKKAKKAKGGDAAKTEGATKDSKEMKGAAPTPAPETK